MEEETEKADLKLNIQRTKIMASGLITSWQKAGGKLETVTDFISWAPKSLQTVAAAMKLNMLTPWEESYDKPRQHIKKAERGGEGEMYGKSNMETYITLCKIDSQWDFAVWLRKLKQGLCINLEVWDGEGDGREVQK